MPYAKLFSSITESSLWSESKDARILFVSMLARADLDGFVEASTPGLSRLANLSLEETIEAIRTLESPDPFSKDLDEKPEQEGRRIAKVPGGWMILNYEIYRAKRDEQQRREFMRKYMKKYREEQKAAKGESVNSCKHLLTPVNHGKPPLAQAEAEAEAERSTSLEKTGGLGGCDGKSAKDGCDAEAPPASVRKSPKPKLSDEEWLADLRADPAYEGIDVTREHAKMCRWCETNGKLPTRRRFVNWLNRAEKPMKGKHNARNQGFDIGGRQGYLGAGVKASGY